MLLVRKVDGHQPAHGRGRLIHQAAGLAEEDIFRVLSDLGDLRLGYPSVKEQVVDDGADEHLEGGRGAQARAGQNGGLAVGVKAPHLAAQLGKSCSHAPDQGRGGVDFRFHRLQRIQPHLAQRIALGLNPDHIGAV